ncbi:MAG: putative DNA-binding transcriptional regulator [Candidatus Omnitrophica bacterium ADurb.Bin277]|nr:MAG: putative DNA-binding transcriptional regulator [Candidatus Omnitrophica bacterium ADurb.Bin277]
MKRASRVEVATVKLWDESVGAVAWNGKRGCADFEYDPAFVKKGLQVSPIVMPLASRIYSFPGLKEGTFHGLPGMLADALPDRFGNKLIDLWLARQGRSAADFSPVERLCYMGTRAMGALEFQPALERVKKSVPLEMDELVDLVSRILDERKNLTTNFLKDKGNALTTIIRVGSSAGGNRAKAVIAWNPKTGDVRSGQVGLPEGFEPWILKFDGVDDQSLGDPKGFGRIEYAYYLMAQKAGITMSASRLLEEGGRAHFMTRRFDRDDEGGKIHVQSLCAIAHYDFNAAGEYGYEQALGVILKLNLGHDSLQEMYRRMVFNVLARNQDDHTRNIDFLMGRDGTWNLAPAFDLVWAYNPTGPWTNRHQMSVNGKRNDFSASDLEAPAVEYDIRDAAEIRRQVAEAVAMWPEFARRAGVDAGMIDTIGKTHRAGIIPGL